MVLSQKQKNELLTGIRLATELKSSSENLKKFLVISAYQYNSDRKIIKLNRILNKNYANLKIYFDLIVMKSLKSIAIVGTLIIL